MFTLTVHKPCVVSDATNLRRPKLVTLPKGKYVLRRQVSPFEKWGLRNHWLIIQSGDKRVRGLSEGDWQRRVRGGIVKIEEAEVVIKRPVVRPKARGVYAQHLW